MIKAASWNEFLVRSSSFQEPLGCFGEFNDILGKNGGTAVTYSHSYRLGNFGNMLGLIDLQ